MARRGRVFRATGGGESKLGRWIDGIERACAATDGPALEAFLHSREDAWREMLRKLTFSTIRALRHPESDPGDWLNRAWEIANALESAAGPMAVAFAIRRVVGEEGKNRPAELDGRRFTFAEVMDWVRAREDEGNPLGKDLDAQKDRHPAGGNRPPEQVAHAVMAAIGLGNYSLAGHVVAYLDSRGGSPGEGILVAVLTAWRESLSAVAAEEVRQWRWSHFSTRS